MRGLVVVLSVLLALVALINAWGTARDSASQRVYAPPAIVRPS